jgi:predicted component of type VI protein secretion system
MRWHLVKISGPEPGDCWALLPGHSLLVGSSPFAPVCLPSPSVDSQHCIVRRNECGLWVCDLSSSARTLLNGHPVSQPETRIVPGDVLRVGEVALRLESRDQNTDGWLNWNGGELTRIALHALDNRDSTALPILADALEEAGCPDRSLIDRCRLSAQGMSVAALLLGSSSAEDHDEDWP